MSERMTCPGCGTHTSDVLSRYCDGQPCPRCHLPAEAAAEVISARRTYADEKIQEELKVALLRAGRAEAKVAELSEKLMRIRDALDETR